jgi:hypothetical protein
VAAVAAVQAYAVGLLLHSLHSDPAESHEAVYIEPALHWLRDSTLALPGSLAFLLLATFAARALVGRAGWNADGFGARVAWALAGALGYAIASVPGAVVHNKLFLAGHEGASFVIHSLEEAMITSRYSFAILIVFAAIWGVPWRRSGAGPHRKAPEARPGRGVHADPA